MSDDDAPVYHGTPEGVLKQESQLVGELARCMKLERRDEGLEILRELARCCYNEGRAYERAAHRSAQTGAVGGDRTASRVLPGGGTPH